MFNRLTYNPAARRKPTVTINERVVTNYCVGTFDDEFIHVEDIEYIFSMFHGGKENMKIFLDGEFSYVKPNADIHTFLYDPFTGNKIDWDLIRKAILNIE